MFQSLKRLEIADLLHTLIITNETETLLRIFSFFPPSTNLPAVTGNSVLFRSIFSEVQIV